MSKRETVFPGSSQWATTKSFTPTSEGNGQVSTAPRRVPKLMRTTRIPRINLPINLADPDSNQITPVVDGSPWKHYKTAFGLELGAQVAIVCKIPATDRLFSMHSVSGVSWRERIDILRSLNHENLLLPVEIFMYEDSSYVISDYAAICLDDLVLVRPDEVQLAAFVIQVLHGLCYLASNSLSHGLITSAKILLTTKGVVKIAHCEGCSPATAETQLADARDLGRVMCGLMGEKTEIGAVGDTSREGPLRLKDPTNWSAEAIDFLSLTLSAPIQKLAEHRFLRQAALINELIPLVEFALMSSYRFYNLQNSFMHPQSG